MKAKRRNEKEIERICYKKKIEFINEKEKLDTQHDQSPKNKMKVIINKDNQVSNNNIETIVSQYF